MKAARKKVGSSDASSNALQNTDKEQWETRRSIGKRKTKYACVVDADESTRPRLEGVGHKPHQDHITAKGTNSITHYSLVHKFIPMPQATKIPDAKNSSGERMGNIGGNTGMAADESQKQKRGDRRSKEIRAEKFISRH